MRYLGALAPAAALVSTVGAFEVSRHPIEPRCAYVRGLDIVNRTERDMTELRRLFEDAPMLVFPRKPGDDTFLTPIQFQEFLAEFDPDHDADALERPSDYPDQMLHPFEQFPGAEHVYPRGTYDNLDVYGLRNLTIKPVPPFTDMHIWHSDLWGHPTKRPGMVTGFHIMDQPLIGGDTDFISGETVWEAMPEAVKKASSNMVLELDRTALFREESGADYSGVIKMRKPGTERRDEGIQLVPLVVGPTPAVLPQAGYFHGVAGWSQQRSDAWLRAFMRDYVLPYRFSAQWKLGDVAVFSNRKFLHSSTPASRYLSYPDSATRLLLQCFLPTKKPLEFYMPASFDDRALLEAGWAADEQLSAAAVKAARMYFSSHSHPAVVQSDAEEVVAAA
ncbi:hypothetical protein JKP88DRAFT_245629 [Tribonema minus]|uniref:TauD/TfdA-like domain-containing protein n=1 Tax=Tribonema minus TaxID=303371 RepID=A0A835YYP2_9STRA|nr:hypothetical protein JKP88DRAFT_245629 [Tribonema minus]